MLISLRNLGKPFLTWKRYLQKEKIKNNGYTKNNNPSTTIEYVVLSK